tara:strand:- start:185 stop:820 length:636 start_codon:yes stop_codon:yes gene_type:complete
MTLSKTISLVIVGFITLSTTTVMAIEEAKYDVILKDNDVEIRHYAPHIVAEIIVTGDIEEVGNKAFTPLFDYISGQNTTQSEIAMTAPVAQQTSGQDIAMTAPVSQQKSASGWAVSFMMPDSYTFDTLPIPNDERIVLRQVPSQTIVAIRYSGFWSESNYVEHKTRLENWIQQSHYQANGDAIWARYNAPFTPWFFRRNEVLIPVVDIHTK